MNETDILYALALSYADGLGTVKLRKLINHFGSAQAAWDSSKKERLLVDGLGPVAIKSIGDQTLLRKAENEIRFCSKEGIKIVYYLEDDFPRLLNECPDAPALYFQKGNYQEQDRFLLSIVGTRKMTAYGKAQTQTLVQGLKDLPVTIVSGLAYGVDACAHDEALKVGLPTLAVLAHGLHKVYPAVHRKKADKIMAEGGALISEFSSFHDAEPQNFLQRNRIVAGMSWATVIVESDVKGGAISTVKYANHYNREVFAIPGRNEDRMSAGCNFLIKTHQSQLLTNVKDLLYYFDIEKEKQKPKTRQKELAISLAPEQQAIFDVLKENGKMQIDELALSLEKPTYLLLSDILDMEMSGLVRNLPGKYFELT